MDFSILRSRSEAANLRLPSDEDSNRIPFKIGIVVLEDTAFDTVLSAFDKVCWLQDIFIVGASFFLYLFLVEVVVGPVDLWITSVDKEISMEEIL